MFKLTISLTVDKLVVEPNIVWKSSSIESIIIKTITNTSIKIIVKPFTVNFNNNVRVLNNECLLNGDIIKSNLRRKAVISVCNQSHDIVSYIFSFNERLNNYFCSKSTAF